MDSDLHAGIKTRSSGDGNHSKLASQLRGRAVLNSIPSVALGLALMVVAAACSPFRGSPSPPPDASVLLDVRMAGRIGCASFPYNCTAAVSVLEPGTTVNEAWRPSADDPEWLPDYGGRTTTDHFLPMPVGNMPVLTPGPHLFVVSLLGVSDVPSFNPDGTEATDLLGRCSADADVAAEDSPIPIVISFTPSETTFEASCSIEIGTR